MDKVPKVRRRRRAADAGRYPQPKRQRTQAMKSAHRTIFMGAFLIALFAAAAEAQEADSVKVTIEPVGGDVYVLRAPDAANIVASVGEDGIVMVDDQVASAADEILTSLRRISEKPLRFVINTHVHEDHTGGNDTFRKLAPIIAHRNVRERMMSGAEQRAPEAWPTVTVDGELNLYLNGEDIRVLTLPAAGHTDGDAVVFFVKANVIHMGDVFMPPAASFVDISNGGTILGLIEELEYVLPQIPADAKVVPGHGATSSRADLARGLETLKAMEALMRAGISAGKTMEQIVAERPFDKWKALMAPGVPEDAYIAFFYRELTAN